MESIVKILQIVLTIFEVVLLFNLFIFVHELGHFWAARWRGLKVEKFQVWFGPTLWKKKINGVQWGLGTVPLGGFVALPQMAPMEAVEGKGEPVSPSEELSPISPLDKIIVAFAGPLFSLLLAFAFALLVWQFGKPVSSMEGTRVVGGVVENSAASVEQGLKVGDEILEVDGFPVPGFGGLSDGIMARVAFSEGEKVRFKVRRPGVEEPVNVDLVPKIEESGGFFTRSGIRQVGIIPAFPPLAGSVYKGGPADRAGIRPGDRFLSINGVPVEHAFEVNDAVEAHVGKPMTISVRRKGGEVFDTELTPLKPLSPKVFKDKVMIGVGWTDETALQKPGPGPWQQVKKSASIVFVTLGKLVSPKSNINASHLSSPIGIGGAIYDMILSEYGWQRTLWFCVIINVNLAILNLLPLPILDGGHITLAILEWIRGRSVNIRVLEMVQTAFAVLLLSFMFYVVVIDVRSRNWSGGGEREPLVFPPPASEPATP